MTTLTLTAHEKELHAAYDKGYQDVPYIWNTYEAQSDLSSAYMRGQWAARNDREAEWEYPY